MEPIVSVIVPTYNASKWVTHTINSIQCQTIENIEIILIDDGSTDSTYNILKEKSKDDSRIKVICQSNMGVGYARNTGIKVAKSNFIAPIDADDIWFPQKLEKQLEKYFECKNESGIIYCLSSHINEKGDDLGCYMPFTPEGDVRSAIILRNFIGNGSSPLIRKELLNQVGMYLTRQEQNGAEGCEDWDLYMRLSEITKFGFVPIPLVGYRQRNSCMSDSSRSMAKSYDHVMSKAKKRNPRLPSYYFRWSEGHFYSYLAIKSYRNYDFVGFICSFIRALVSDHVAILDKSALKLFMKSVFSIMLRRKKTYISNEGKVRKPHQISPKSSLKDSIQIKRLRSLVNYH
jgi:glycosyltransferase involved in cell wall biosynthesis